MEQCELYAVGPDRLRVQIKGKNSYCTYTLRYGAEKSIVLEKDDQIIVLEAKYTQFTVCKVDMDSEEIVVCCNTIVFPEVMLESSTVSAFFSHAPGQLCLEFVVPPEHQNGHYRYGACVWPADENEQRTDAMPVCIPQRTTTDVLHGKFTFDTLRHGTLYNAEISVQFCKHNSRTTAASCHETFRYTIGTTTPARVISRLAAPRITDVVQLGGSGGSTLVNVVLVNNNIYGGSSDNQNSNNSDNQNYLEKFAVFAKGFGFVGQFVFNPPRSIQANRSYASVMIDAAHVAAATAATNIPFHLLPLSAQAITIQDGKTNRENTDENIFWNSKLIYI